MKDKPNEWVSISDLMAGVMAVVMLLLVVSVLQQVYLEEKHQNELESSVAFKKKNINKIFDQMNTTFTNLNLADLINFDSTLSKITIKDGIFERGSAKITPTVQAAFEQTQSKIKEFLEIVPNGKIYVEGHTDNIPVARPVIDHSRFGAVYDDNYTLSAARAREARRFIIGNLDKEEVNRVIVAGFGSSKPLNPEKPEDGVNRRVEIRFTIEVED
jgi:chemotaxis protein MotB